MRGGDVLRRIGRPMSDYPGLAHILGSVNAAVLFCQLFTFESCRAGQSRHLQTFTSPPAVPTSRHSTVTDFARFLGLSISAPRKHAA